MAFHVHQLSSSLNKSTLDDTLKANKRLAKAKNENTLIILGLLELIENSIIVSHNDASSRNLEDEWSQGGLITCFVAEDNYSSPIMLK